MIQTRQIRTAIVTAIVTAIAMDFGFIMMVAIAGPIFSALSASQRHHDAS
jgi:hypothetical protein